MSYDIYQKITEMESSIKLLQTETAEQSRLLFELGSSAIKPVYCVKEAAAILRLAPATVSEYCRLGKLKAKRTAGKEGPWMITPDSLKHFISKN